MRKLVLAFAVIGGLTAPALASNCPAMVGWINKGLETAQLSDADRARVIELRDEGERLHEEGQHSASMTALTKALVILDL
jgi:hypothetical protein